MTTTPYTLQVLAAYEGEIAGAAYFDALTSAHPQQAAFLAKCAALERATASQLSGLIRKYQLTPQRQETLEDRGALDARMESGLDWWELLQKSIGSYAQYVAQFRALEAIGPAEDLPVLAALTAHEVQLIEWMRAETASAAPGEPIERARRR
jgi:hypothetical protein